MRSVEAQCTFTSIGQSVVGGQSPIDFQAGSSMPERQDESSVLVIGSLDALPARVILAETIIGFTVVTGIAHETFACERQRDAIVRLTLATVQARPTHLTCIRCDVAENADVILV